MLLDSFDRFFSLFWREPRQVECRVQSLPFLFPAFNSKEAIRLSAEEKEELEVKITIWCVSVRNVRRIERMLSNAKRMSK